MIKRNAHVSTILDSTRANSDYKSRVLKRHRNGTKFYFALHTQYALLRSPFSFICIAAFETPLEHATAILSAELPTSASPSVCAFNAPVHNCFSTRTSEFSVEPTSGKVNSVNNRHNFAAAFYRGYHRVRCEKSSDCSTRVVERSMRLA